MRDTEPDELSIQIFHAVKIGLLDKIIQVNQDTISLFVATVQGVFKNTRKYNSGLHKLQYGQVMTTIIDLLLAKSGESHIKLK